MINYTLKKTKTRRKTGALTTLKEHFASVNNGHDKFLLTMDLTPVQFISRAPKHIKNLNKK
jgi:hypothetical protein